MNNHETKEWFASWFDSPFYHILYGHRDYAEAAVFIDSLVKSLGLKEGTKALDLACGKGRHAQRMNANGLSVHGIDLSPESIAHCRQFQTQSLRFSVGDMRDKFPNSPYDVIFNLFTSFGYFDSDEENEKVVENMADSLKNGGILVIDYLNVRPAIDSLPKKETKEVRGTVFEIEKKIENDRILKQIEFTHEGKEYSFTESVKILELNWFSTILNSQGLTIDRLYGDYHLHGYDEESSPRLIMVARKS